jgi:flavin-dependent dehydrogenase
VRNTTNINIYGAGLSGLTAAIYLAKNGYDVTVYEKERRIGGLHHCIPSIHMTPIDFQKIYTFTGIDVKPCFTPLHTFKAYIYSKILYLNPQYLYVTERGPQKTSLDFYLYTHALKAGVNFEFSQPLTLKILSSLPNPSIIATGSYSELLKYLRLPHTSFRHFNSHKKISLNYPFCLAYFIPYLAGYGYAYIAAKNQLASVEVDFSLNQMNHTYLKKFKKHLKQTENITFKTWSPVIDNIPQKIHLIRKIHGNTYILAGALSGFHDPLFGFGVNSALISGIIAAKTVISKKTGMKEFNRFAPTLTRMYILSKIYNHIPLKHIFIPQLFTNPKRSIPIIGKNLQNIPGYTHKNCFQILRIEK